MQKFTGFPPGKVKMTDLPGQFFSELLPLIDDLAELKVTLFCFWALHQKEGEYRYLRYHDFANDEPLMNGLAIIDTNVLNHDILQAALSRAVERGTLLCVEVNLQKNVEQLYFMNTPRGQEAVRQLQTPKGWRPREGDNPVEILPERPTIYRLYEENIGPLTSHISDELKDAEKEYSSEWVEKAILTAVEMNKRNWRYILGILKRQSTEGQSGNVVVGDALENGEWYTPKKPSNTRKR